MRWDDFRRSDNVEDSRQSGANRGLGGRMGGGLPVGGRGGLGLGAIVVLGILSYALGIDPSVLIGGAEMLTGSGGQRFEQPTNVARGTPQDRTGQFVAAVLGDTEDRWTEIMRENGRTYRAPRLRLFADAEQSACGFARSAMGPFYCPSDQRIYLDTSFFRDLEVRFRGCTGRACEFSQAYVIAHEVGHHVQNLLGVLSRAQQLQQGRDRAAANRIQVQVELQADCFAGLWAARSQQKWQFLEPGDIEAAMQSAAAIGDDRLQKQSQGYVVPDAFTHGSSAQRMRWFRTGLTSGTLAACDTFNAQAL